MTTEDAKNLMLQFVALSPEGVGIVVVFVQGSDQADFNMATMGNLPPEIIVPILRKAAGLDPDRMRDITAGPRQ